MNMIDVSSEGGGLKSSHINTVFSSDMDYSLLASDMQKFLNIAPKKNICKLNNNTSSSKHSEKKKLLTKHCAYLEDIELHKCPLCSTNFNTKDLLARHALRIHYKAVLTLLQDVSTEQHLKCCFCVHKVMHRHQKLLLLHLEKKHTVEFVSYFKQSFMPLPEIPLGLVHDLQDMSLSGVVQQKKDNCHSDSCKFSREMDVNTELIGSSSKPENFDGTLFPCPEENNVPNPKNSMNQMGSNSFAKRKLVLDGSVDCRSSKVLLIKENIPPKESLITTLAKSGWKHLAGKPFTCGRCRESFSCNALLLDHVSGRHRGPLRLLQPLYTCGLCSASFYKNSFLVRHCYQHHTPKCV